MSRTATGGFPIGFRYTPLSAWSHDLARLIAWVKEKNFGALDVQGGAEQVTAVNEAGLKVGSVDLPKWQGMLSLDADKRRDAVARNQTCVEECAAAGPLNYFVVMLPKDPHAPPQEVFRAMGHYCMNIAKGCGSRLGSECEQRTQTVQSPQLGRV